MDRVPSAAELLARYRSGDHAAAGELLARHLGAARDVARALLGNGNSLRRSLDSSDVVQDACVLALRDLHRARAPSDAQFVAWFGRIVANRVRDAARYELRERRDASRRAGGELADLVAELPCGGPTPSQVAMGAELAERYFGCLEALPQRQRDAIVLHRHAGASSSEIAAELELPSADAARALLSRALRGLTDLMADAGSAGGARESEAGP